MEAPERVVRPARHAPRGRFWLWLAIAVVIVGLILGKILWP